MHGRSYSHFNSYPIKNRKIRKVGFRPQSDVIRFRGSERYRRNRSETLRLVWSWDVKKEMQRSTLSLRSMVSPG